MNNLKQEVKLHYIILELLVAAVAIMMFCGPPRSWTGDTNVQFVVTDIQDRQQGQQLLLTPLYPPRIIAHQVSGLGVSKSDILNCTTFDSVEQIEDKHNTVHQVHIVGLSCKGRDLLVDGLILESVK